MFLWWSEDPRGPKRSSTSSVSLYPAPSTLFHTSLSTRSSTIQMGRCILWRYTQFAKFIFPIPRRYLPSTKTLPSTGSSATTPSLTVSSSSSFLPQSSSTPTSASTSSLEGTHPWWWGTTYLNLFINLYLSYSMFSPDNKPGSWKSPWRKAYFHFASDCWTLHLL